MNRWAYTFIAAGSLFAGVNILVNGLEVLFPTCFGYVLAAIGAYGLRDDHFLFRVTVVFSGLLAVLTFPELFRHATRTESWQTFDVWTFWPVVALEYLFPLLVAMAIWSVAWRRSENVTFWLLVMTPAVVVAAFVTWYLMPQSTNEMFILSVLVYEMPMLYLALVSFIAGRRLE